jgi:hypothetical protein
MSDLIDFSFVIIALAILGFIIKDSFYSYQRYNLPYELRDESERLFVNIAIGLWFISLGWIVLATIIFPSPELVKAIFYPFAEQLNNLVISGYLDQSTITESIKNFVVYGNLLTIASMLFLVIITISMLAGAISTTIQYRFITVSFINEEPKKFRRIIKESDDFFYFESLNDFRKWKAIPKKDIMSIKNTYMSETNFFNKANPHLINFFNNHPRINAIIGETRTRRKIIFAIAILMGIIFIIPSLFFPGLMENTIFKWIFLLIVGVFLVLVIIEESLVPQKSDEEE